MNKALYKYKIVSVKVGLYLWGKKFYTTITKLCEVKVKGVFQTAGIMCTKLNEKCDSICREQAILICCSVKYKAKNNERIQWLYLSKDAFN